MKRYCVNNIAQSNGDHEVHTMTCSYVPSDRKDLGWHNNCASAVVVAQNYYKKSNGCYWCSRECHTR